MVTASDGLSTLAPGQLVEIPGEVTGNPLVKMLNFFFSIAPFMGLDLSEPDAHETPSPSSRAERRRQQRQRQPRQPSPLANTTATEPEAEIDETALTMIKTMRADVERSPILDLLLQAQGDLRAILTLARDYLPPEGEAYLLGGRFIALGKVTAVLDQAAEINLLRRTVLGAAGPEMARQLLAEFQSTTEDQLHLDIGEPIVRAPALQLLPLAIFV